MKQRNFVAKHLRTFHKPSVEVDKKKEMRKNGHTDDQEAHYQLTLEEEE